MGLRSAAGIGIPPHPLLTLSAAHTYPSLTRSGRFQIDHHDTPLSVFSNPHGRHGHFPSASNCSSGVQTLFLYSGPVMAGRTKTHTADEIRSDHFVALARHMRFVEGHFSAHILTTVRFAVVSLLFFYPPALPKDQDNVAASPAHAHI